MYYIIYKTTNLINGKFYIGSHKTIDPNDNYMGSGKLLQRAITKYGLDNFKKEVLFVFDNPEDMFAKEAEIVNEDFLSEENTYNLKVGGFGGFDYLNSSKYYNSTHTKSHLDMMVEKRKLKHPNGTFYGKSLSEESRLKISLKKMGRKTFAGKTHSDETKAKISSANKTMTGDRNSQFGTIWITDGIKSKKIKKEDQIPPGWSRGRIINLED